MMQGPIKRAVRYREEKRAEAQLPTAWIGGVKTQSAWTDGTWVTRTPVRSAPAGIAPVLVLLGNGSEGARAALLAHAAAGARVYALVGPGWGKEQDDNQLFQAPRVLVRRLSEVPASAVHAGNEAWLWIGGGFILRLDPNQAESLRLTFLRLFWHEATEEAWSGGRQFVWRPARERPFDVPELPSSASVRLEPANAHLSGNPRGALMHVRNGLPPDDSPRRLWFPAGPDHHERLSKLVHSGVEVLWEDRGLPDIHVNDGTGEVLLPGTRGRLRLRLTAHQAPELTRLLEAQPAWRFQANVRLGDSNHRAAQFWLPGDAAARMLEAEQRIEVPDVPANSLREVEVTAPASLPAAQPLALTVRYQWTVVPPRMPTGAEEDALLGRWRKLDQDWTARLSRVREALRAAEGDRGRIGNAFSRLLSAMLGFERTNKGLLARVDALEAQRPSVVGPSGAPALLNQLGEIEAAARKLQVDLEEAERKAREEEEREKQMAAWKAQVEAAQRDLPQKKSALAETTGLREKTESELKTLKEEVKTASKDAKKDLSARENRLSDDLRRLEKDVARLKGEIKSLETQADSTFEFRPPPTKVGMPSQLGGRFIPALSVTKPDANVPQEALPEVGILRNLKGQRYLAIKSWDELDAGEKAASRLSAKLVAPENL